MLRALTNMAKRASMACKQGRTKLKPICAGKHVPTSAEMAIRCHRIANWSGAWPSFARSSRLSWTPRLVWYCDRGRSDTCAVFSGRQENSRAATIHCCGSKPEGICSTLGIAIAERENSCWVHFSREKSLFQSQSGFRGKAGHDVRRNKWRSERTALRASTGNSRHLTSLKSRLLNRRALCRAWTASRCPAR